MADFTTHLDQIEDGAGATVRVNELADAMSPLSLMGRRAETTTGLVWGYYGGRVNGTSKANGTVALTDDAANYIVMHRTTLVVTAATTTTNWDDTATYARLYAVTAASGVVTDYEDHRLGSLFQVVGSAVSLPFEWGFMCSDLSTALSAAADVGGMVFPCDVGGVEFIFDLLSAPSTSGAVQLDIKLNGGASVFSTKATIDQNETSTRTAATASVLSTSAFSAGDKIMVTIDAGGTGAKGLQCTVKAVRT